MSTLNTAVVYSCNHCLLLRCFLHHGTDYVNRSLVNLSFLSNCCCISITYTHVINHRYMLLAIYYTSSHSCVIRRQPLEAQGCRIITDGLYSITVCLFS